MLSDYSFRPELLKDALIHNLVGAALDFFGWLKQKQ
jgi:hypothetical protein